MIGDSGAGAVRIALGDRGAPGAYEFAFFASAGSKFGRVGLDGDCVAGFEVDSGGDRDLRGYDAFVLQGRLPTACGALAFERHLRPLRYSQDVRALALRDWRDSHKGWAMALTLHERYRKPVLAISRNIFAGERVGAKAERGQADAAFAAMLAPLRFVAFPDSLFEHDGQVRRQFYNDEWHYNCAAGDLILDSLIARLDAAFV